MIKVLLFFLLGRIVISTKNDWTFESLSEYYLRVSENANILNPDSFLSSLLKPFFALSKVPMELEVSSPHFFRRNL